MGYENLNNVDCDLSIGQKLYYEQNFYLFEMEIVSIDCLTRNIVLIKMKSEDEKDILEWHSAKTDVFGKSNFYLYAGELTRHFYKDKNEFLNKIVKDIDFEITQLNMRKQEICRSINE